MNKEPKSSLLIYVCILVLLIIWVTYPPYDTIGQVAADTSIKESPSSFPTASIEPDTLSKIRKENKNLTKSLKVKQEKALKLAEEANKVSKQVKPAKVKIHIIKLDSGEEVPDPILYDEEETGDSILVTSDSTFRVIKKDKPSFWKRLFGKKN